MEFITTTILRGIQHLWTMYLTLQVLILASFVPTLVHLQSESNPDITGGVPPQARTGATVPLSEARSSVASGGEVQHIYLDPRRIIDAEYPSTVGPESSRLRIPIERRRPRYFEGSRRSSRINRPPFRRRRQYSREPPLGRPYGEPLRRSPPSPRRRIYGRRRPFYDPYDSDYEPPSGSRRYRYSRRYAPRHRVSRMRDRREYYPRYRDEGYRSRDVGYRDIGYDGYRERPRRGRRRGYAGRRRFEYREMAPRDTSRRSRVRRIETGFSENDSYVNDRLRDIYQPDRTDSSRRRHTGTRREYRESRRERFIDESPNERRGYRRPGRDSQMDYREDRHSRYNPTNLSTIATSVNDYDDALYSFEYYNISDRYASRSILESPLRDDEYNSYIDDIPWRPVRNTTRMKSTDNLSSPKTDTFESGENIRQTPSKSTEPVLPQKSDGFISKLNLESGASVESNKNVSSTNAFVVQNADVTVSPNNADSSSLSKIRGIPGESEAVQVTGNVNNINLIIPDVSEIAEYTDPTPSFPGFNKSFHSALSMNVSKATKNDGHSPEKIFDGPPKAINENQKKERIVGSSNTFPKPHFINIPIPTGIHSATSDEMIVDLTQNSVQEKSSEHPSISTKEHVKNKQDTSNSIKNDINKSNKTRERLTKPIYNVHLSDTIIPSAATNIQTNMGIKVLPISKPDVIIPSFPDSVKGSTRLSARNHTIKLSNVNTQENKLPLSNHRSSPDGKLDGITNRFALPDIKQQTSNTSNVKETIRTTQTRHIQSSRRPFKDDKPTLETDIPPSEKPIKDERVPQQLRKSDSGNLSIPIRDKPPSELLQRDELLPVRRRQGPQKIYGDDLSIPEGPLPPNEISSISERDIPRQRAQSIIPERDVRPSERPTIDKRQPLRRILPRSRYRDEPPILESARPAPERSFRDGRLHPRRRLSSPRSYRNEPPIFERNATLRLGDEGPHLRRRRPLQRRYRDESAISGDDIRPFDSLARDERPPLDRRRPPVRRYRGDTPLAGRDLLLRRDERPSSARRQPPRRLHRDEPPSTGRDDPPPERSHGDDRRLSRRRRPPPRRYREEPSSRGRLRNERPGGEILPFERPVRDERPSLGGRLSPRNRYRDEPPSAGRDDHPPERPQGDDRTFSRRRRPPTIRYRDELSERANDHSPSGRRLRDERRPPPRRYRDEPSFIEDGVLPPERPVRDERRLLRRRRPSERRYRDDLHDTAIDSPPERLLRDERPLPRRRPPPSRSFRDEPLINERPTLNSLTLPPRSSQRNETSPSEKPPRNDTYIRADSPSSRRYSMSDSVEPPFFERNRISRQISPDESRHQPMESRLREDLPSRRRRPLSPDDRFRDESRRYRPYRREPLPPRRQPLRSDVTYSDDPLRIREESYRHDSTTSSWLRQQRPPGRRISRPRAPSERDYTGISTLETTAAGDTLPTAEFTPAERDTRTHTEEPLVLGVVRARGGENGWPVHGGYCHGPRCADGGLAAGVANGTGTGTLEAFLERQRTGTNEDIVAYKRDLGSITTT